MAQNSQTRLFSDTQPALRVFLYMIRLSKYTPTTVHGKFLNHQFLYLLLPSFFKRPTSELTNVLTFILRYVQECHGLSWDVPGYHMHLYICIQYYTYHLPRSLRREPSLLPIKRGWSLTMHSAPPPLLMGRGCGCSSDRVN